MEGKDLLERLGRGERPEVLGLKRTSDGLVDMRGLRLAQAKPRARFRAAGATFDYVPGKPIFQRLHFRHLDLSEAYFENSYWEDCSLSHVRCERLRGRGANFASTRMEAVSFVRADLRYVNWGLDRLDGPLVVDTEFVRCDLRGSMYGHPLFRNCKWVDCNLKGVNFGGTRLENCTLVGLLDEVMFHGRYRDPEPKIANLRNPMRNVEFSRAELKNVSFDDGIDLTSCTFPAEGYLRIPHPRRAYKRALQQVKETWSGNAKERAVFYLKETVKFVPEDQPLDVIRPRDFVEGAFGRDLGREVAEDFVRLLEEASKK